MNFIYQSKLFKQLTGVIGFLVLLAVGIPSVFAVFYITPKVTEDRYHQIMRNDVAFLANRLDWHLAKSIGDVEFLSSQIRLSEPAYLEAAEEKIDLFVKSSAIFTGGVVTDNKGIMLLFHSLSRGIIEVTGKHDLSQREYIQYPLTKNQSYLSNFIMTETHPRPVIFVSSPVVENGQTTGVLALTINLWNEANIFYTLFNGFSDKKQGNIYVVDEEGTIIYHWDKERVGNRLNNELLSMVLEEQEGIIENISIEDHKKTIAFRNLEGNNWVVIYEIDHHEIYAMNKIGRIMAFGTMALVLILGLWASSIFVKIILRPLAEITAATEQVAAGDLSKSIDIKGHQDFQALIENFNIMLQNLRFQYQELEKLSLYDHLTSVANRRYFEQQLEQELERAYRMGHSSTIMIMDIDNFKEVNDKFGHLAGDKALIALGTVLKDSVRSIDLPARYGGDEFLVLLPETTIEQGEIVAQKISEKARQISIDTRKGKISFSISIGMVSTEEAKIKGASHRDLKNKLMKWADEALYQAKLKGKNRVEVYRKA